MGRFTSIIFNQNKFFNAMPQFEFKKDASFAYLERPWISSLGVREREKIINQYLVVQPGKQYSISSKWCRSLRV
jgi:hypothetical protein